ncbi:MAG: hypothetical protein Ct9H300mP25_16800 [Acidobacteriota bacterium]|nr:MAG: hypothetical protein Ct9H300mP25_16800 [Acidobacteriota bacterium]
MGGRHGARSYTPREDGLELYANGCRSTPTGVFFEDLPKSHYGVVAIVLNSSGWRIRRFDCTIRRKVENLSSEICCQIPGAFRRR